LNKLKEELDGAPLWGLPNRLSDELVKTYDVTPVRWIGQWLFIIIMIGGFAGLLPLWIWCDKILTQNAIDAAASVDGFAYDTNFGIGLLIGLFIWIGVSAILSYCVVRITPMPYKGTLFLMSQMDRRNKSAGIIPKRPKLDLSVTPHSVAEMINNYVNSFIGKSLLYVSPFVILAGFITQAELTKFTITSPTGLHTSGLFSKTLTLDAWQDVETVKLGCNQTDDGASLVYDVIWPDGRSERLPIDTHINSKDWITNLESVDAEISKGDAIFERWKWLNRNALHPQCLRSFYEEQGEGSKTRIDRLLRIGELD